MILSTIFVCACACIWGTGLKHLLTELVIDIYRYLKILDRTVCRLVCFLRPFGGSKTLDLLI